MTQEEKVDILSVSSKVDAGLKSYMDYKYPKVKAYADSAENIVRWIVHPVLSCLGWDLAEPKAVRLNYAITVDCIEKFPVALLDGRLTSILIDVVNGRLEGKEYLEVYKRMRKCFSHDNKAAMCIITNGREFEFITDNVEENVLDIVPFFKFDLENLTDHDVNLLSRFSRDIVWKYGIESVIRDVRPMNYYSNIIIEWFRNQCEGMSDEVLSFIRYNILKKDVDDYTIKYAIQQLVDRVTDTEKTREIEEEKDKQKECNAAESIASESNTAESIAAESNTKDTNVSGIYTLDEICNNYPNKSKLIAVDYGNSNWYNCFRVVGKIWTTLIAHCEIDCRMSIDHIKQAYTCAGFMYSKNSCDFRRPGEHDGLYYELNRSGKEHIKKFRQVLAEHNQRIDNKRLLFVAAEDLKGKYKGMTDNNLISLFDMK